jgi:hypothetical protein
MQTNPQVQIELHSLEAAPRPEIAKFLDGHPHATAFYSTAWHDVLQDAYGHACDYWIARANGLVVGLLAVARIRAPGFGEKRVALPYQFHSGAPLANSPEIASALAERALRDAEQANARYLEVRSHASAPALEALGFRHVDSGLVLTTVPLAGLGDKTFRRNHLRGVRSAEEAGVRVRSGTTLEDLRAFRRLLLEESRRLGVPQAGWRFFRALHDRMPDGFRLFLAERAGRLIGALFNLEDSRTVFGRYGLYGSDEALRLHVPQALYAHAIRDAAARGCEAFNCGISAVTDKGLIHWKEGWGGVSAPLHVYVRAIRAEPPNVGEYLEGYGFAKSIWRRLPLGLVSLGGRIVTHWVC